MLTPEARGEPSKVKPGAIAELELDTQLEVRPSEWGNSAETHLK